MKFSDFVFKREIFSFFSHVVKMKVNIQTWGTGNNKLSFSTQNRTAASANWPL